MSYVTICAKEHSVDTKYESVSISDKVTYICQDVFKKIFKEYEMKKFQQEL